ncbi:MAG: ATP-binding protein [Planctomycetota bacterium]|jgi:anti-sigma regulatory factor (Ser/Thr protein kinase)|nr:ATP-binding protein [Planctomycetota bacterium]
MPNRMSFSREDWLFLFQFDIADPGEMPADIDQLVTTLMPFLDQTGVQSEEANSIYIAVEELLLNIATHGKAKEGEAEKELVAKGEIDVSPENLILRLSDNSPPFDPRQAPPPDLTSDPLERSIGGLGIFILFNLFTEFAYSYSEGYNTGVWTLKRQVAEKRSPSPQEKRSC